jgi:hypothetical protein
MAVLIPKEKQLPVTQTSDSGSSDISSTVPNAADDDHVFKDPVTEKYWREVYDKAEYEGRHRFDPHFSWTPQEEKRLVRKVRGQALPRRRSLTHSSLT